MTVDAGSLENLFYINIRFWVGLVSNICMALFSVAYHNEKSFAGHLSKKIVPRYHLNAFGISL